MTATPADAVVFPAASLAMAVSVCDPLDALELFQLTVYGAARSSAPSGAPSSMNCTPATPTLSEAVALTAIVPDTTPAGGDEMLTVGAIGSRAMSSICAPMSIPSVDCDLYWLEGRSR